MPNEQILDESFSQKNLLQLQLLLLTKIETDLKANQWNFANLNG